MDLIVIGLAGKAGSGKTTVANRIAPQVRNMGYSLDPNGQGDGYYTLTDWHHLYYAMPIYSIVSAKQNTTGLMYQDRVSYQIHETLLDLFGRSPIYGAPAYHQLVGMVMDMTNRGIPVDGKPRSFMQWAGTEVCRAFDNECFTKWMRRKIKEVHRTAIQELEAELKEEENTAPDTAIPHFSRVGIVISDVRFQNEAELIKSYDKGVLIRFDVSDETQKQRLYDRDGYLLSSDQSTHASETSVSSIDNNLFDAIIDTSDMTIAEQVQATLQAVGNKMRMESNA